MEVITILTRSKILKGKAPISKKDRGLPIISTIHKLRVSSSFIVHELVTYSFSRASPLPLSICGWRGAGEKQKIQLFPRSKLRGNTLF